MLKEWKLILFMQKIGKSALLMLLIVWNVIGLKH